MKKPFNIVLAVLMGITGFISLQRMFVQAQQTENDNALPPFAQPSNVFDPGNRQWDVVETAKKEGDFTIFTQLVWKAGLAEILQQAKEITIFAPTDEAFSKLPPQELANLLKPEYKEKLISILQGHMIGGAIKSKDLPRLGHKVPTLDDETKLTISDKNGLRVNGAKVVIPDMLARNGVVHGIDTVLMP